MSSQNFWNPILEAGVVSLCGCVDVYGLRSRLTVTTTATFQWRDEAETVFAGGWIRGSRDGRLSCRVGSRVLRYGLVGTVDHEDGAGRRLSNIWERLYWVSVPYLSSGGLCFFGWLVVVLLGQPGFRLVRELGIFLDHLARASPGSPQSSLDGLK